MNSTDCRWPSVRTGTGESPLAVVKVPSSWVRYLPNSALLSVTFPGLGNVNKFPLLSALETFTIPCNPWNCLRMSTGSMHR